MAQAIIGDHIEDVSNENNNIPQNGPNSDPTVTQANDLKTQDKFKIMASQFKAKSKENAQKVAQKSKERLSLDGQLRQARISLERYVNPKFLDKQIKEDTILPKWVLKKAKGIVFLTVVKAGFLFAGNIGTGCVIVRKPNGGWTGPSSIMVAGVSFGFLAGASKVDYIMILPDDRAVKQFTGNGQLRLGGELQVALGPVGRDGSGSIGAGDKGVSVIFSYSHAQGLYGGLALDGKVISVRPDCNDKYYKKKVTCFEILTGNIEPPLNEDYDMIIHLLDSYCMDDLTPMRGERISIDDLDNNINNDNISDNNTNNNNNDDFKQNYPQNNEPGSTPNNNNNDMMDEIGQKFAKGMNNLKSMLFGGNDNDNDIGNTNANQNQNEINNDGNDNNNNNTYNNMGISPQSESPISDTNRPPF